MKNDLPDFNSNDPESTQPFDPLAHYMPIPVPHAPLDPKAKQPDIQFPLIPDEATQPHMVAETGASLQQTVPHPPQADPAGMAAPNLRSAVQDTQPNRRVPLPPGPAAPIPAPVLPRPQPIISRPAAPQTPPAPTPSLAANRPVSPAVPPVEPKTKRRFSCLGCLGLLGAALLVMAAGLLLSLLIPGNSNVLLLGLDSRAGQGNLGRTDTIIVASIRPLAGQVHALSIPRDLWVPIPGVGENRINTAHFFAEANQPGSGPAAAQQVVENNFKVSIDYYARIRFDGFQGIVDAMGGIDIQLDKATGTLPAGQQHLNGEQALAFVRDRKEGDDFFRMAHAQILLNAALKQALQPSFWPRLPAVLAAVQSAVDSNIPPWQLPRLGLTFLRAGLSGGLETRSLTREMASPFTTSNGAAVLQPHWDLIQPLVKEFLISPTGR